MSVNTQLVTVSVDTLVAGVPAGAAQDVSCVLTLGDYSQTRGKTEYLCMSSDDSTVGLGSITRAPLQMTTLYNELANDAEGQAILKEAFDTNDDIHVTIEFDNSLGVNGTQLSGIMGVGVYNMTFPKDGKIGADFTLEFMEEPVLKEASAA